MRTPAILHVLFALALLGALPGTIGAAEPATAPPPPDPELVAAQVTSALHKAQGVPGRQIIVSTHADTIVLNGEVASTIELQRAGKVAADAAQGLRISNNLVVVPLEGGGLLRERQRLVRGVEDALKNDTRTANLGVAVSFSTERVIGLHGLVPSQESRSAAMEVAQKAAGDSPVDNRLVVPGDR